MKSKKRLAFISKTVNVSFGLSILICSPAHAAIELAKIKGTTITLEDFEKKYNDNLRYFPLKAPTKKEVLDDLIKRELAIQEAKAIGLDKDPEIKDRFDTLLYSALLERKLAKEFEKITISDEQVKSFYARNPEIRTSHIFVSVRPDAPASEQKQAFEKIKNIYEKQHISDGKGVFSDVAQRFSEGPAAPMGGDIDYQTKDRLDPAYYEAAIKLKEPGKVSGIVRTNFGYHIIKLTAVKKWEDNDLDKTQIKRLVFEEERLKILNKYMAELRAKARVISHPELLKEKQG